MVGSECVTRWPPLQAISHSSIKLLCSRRSPIANTNAGALARKTEHRPHPNLMPMQYYFERFDDGFDFKF